MAPAHGGFEFGPFRLDVSKRVLWREGELVALPPKALDVLVALVEQRGDVVRKDELMERVWPDTFVEEANLSVQVALLRKTLGTPEGGGAYIETVARRGYRFVAPIRRLGPPSLAVLPFRVLSSGTEDEYLGIGMADALITRLASLGSVVVRPTSAVLKYAAAAVDPSVAGRELEVDAVLDGRIQREGSRLRVTVQLVPQRRDEPSWAGTFEADLTGLFAVQDAVAEQAARALALHLGAEERRLLSRRPTEDLEAYQAYVKGRYFWSRFTAESLGRSFACFQEAAERDPRFALPHSGLADGYAILGFSGLLAPREAWPLAMASARRALELDESVAEAHISLAYVTLFQDWDWAAAGRELERAVALGPNAAAPHQWYGLYLDMLGRFAEARQEIERARELDPLSVVLHTMRTLQFYLARDRESELEQARRTVELDPGQFLGQWCFGLACLGSGLAEEAVAAHRRAVELAGGIALLKAVLAYTLAVTGHADEARSLLGELDADGGGSAYQRATVEVALGETERAIASLTRACDERDPWVLWIKVDPMLDPLRADPRFVALVSRVFPGR
jgi:DNA-binding winged helix-turn-helix (wHTH) protein/tetratricopeptide (TPR) repeat protein